MAKIGGEGEKRKDKQRKSEREGERGRGREEGSGREFCRGLQPLASDRNWSVNSSQWLSL